MQHGPATTLVYMPSRARMAWCFIGYIALLVFVALGMTYWLSRPGSNNQPMRAIVLIVVGLAGLIMSLFCGALAYRIVWYFPSIIVNKDGIIDNASLIYRGTGFISWKEIAAITVRYPNPIAYPPNRIFRRQVLAITPAKLAFRSTSSLSVRLQQICVRAAVGTPVWYTGIPRFMLPDDAVAVCQEIGDTYERWYRHKNHPVRFM